MQDYALAGETGKARRLLRANSEIVYYEQHNRPTKWFPQAFPDGIMYGTKKAIISSRDYHAKEGGLDADKLEVLINRENRKRGRKLETAAVATAIIGILGGIFFISYNITGNVIGSLSQVSSNWIGGILFLIGIIGAFVYFTISS